MIGRMDLSGCLYRIKEEKRISFKTVNQFNYTIKCINIDSNNKTFNFQEGIVYHTISKKTMEQLVEILKEEGYKEN